MCFKGTPAERQELANDFMTATRTRFTLDDSGCATNLEYVDENPDMIAIGFGDMVIDEGWTWNYGLGPAS